MLNVKQGRRDYQFFCLWLDPTGNRTRVYRFSSRRSIHLTTDWFGNRLRRSIFAQWNFNQSCVEYHVIFSKVNLFTFENFQREHFGTVLCERMLPKSLVKNAFNGNKIVFAETAPPQNFWHTTFLPENKDNL